MKNYKYFKENDFFADRVDAIVGDLENEIESSIKTVQNQSAETFWKAYTDGWDDNNSGNSLIDGVSNVVGGVGTKNDPAYVSRLSAETLSDDDIDRIVDDIVREEIEGSLEAEREKIIQRLDRQIETSIRSSPLRSINAVKRKTTIEPNLSLNDFQSMSRSIYDVLS